MSVSRFAQPEAVRIPLSRGDWLLVKKRLSAGERRAAHARMYTATGGEPRVDPLQVGLAMNVAYLIDWSLTEYPILGRPPDEVVAALNALTEEDYDEIDTAISAHVTQMERERDVEKKAQRGGTELPATSPSLAGVAGGTSGSPS